MLGLREKYRLNQELNPGCQFCSLMSSHLCHIDESLGEARKLLLLDPYTDIKLNLWHTAAKGATPGNWTSATDLQMAGLRDNVIRRARILMT